MHDSSHSSFFAVPPGFSARNGPAKEIDRLMITFTRSELLTSARLQYRVLADRARSLASGRADYIDQLVVEWDRELERRAGLSGSIVVTDNTLEAIKRLVERVNAESLDADELVEWLDIFPDAIAELFPPSAATYRLVSEVKTPQVAGNRQPSLALAA